MSMEKRIKKQQLSKGYFQFNQFIIFSNIRMVASVLYLVIMEYFKENL